MLYSVILLLAGLLQLGSGEECGLPSRSSGGGPTCNPMFPCWNAGHRQTEYDLGPWPLGARTLIVNSTLYEDCSERGTNETHAAGNCPNNQGVRQDGFMQNRNGHPDKSGWMKVWDNFLAGVNVGYNRSAVGRGGTRPHPTIEEIMTMGMNCSDPTMLCYPKNHPNLDMICSCNRNSIQVNMVDPDVGGEEPCFSGLPAAVVYAGHPNIDNAIRNNDPLPPNHPDLDMLFGHLVTTSHPGLMNRWNDDGSAKSLDRNAFVRYPNHPLSDVFLERTSPWLTAGALLSFHCAGFLVLAILVRLVQGKYCVCCSPDENRFKVPMRSVSVRYSALPDDAKDGSMTQSTKSAAPGIGAPLLSESKSKPEFMAASARSELMAASSMTSSSVYRSRCDMTDSRLKSSRRPSELFRSKMMSSARSNKLLIESSRSLRYTDKMEHYAGKNKQQSKDPLYDFGEYADLPAPPPASAPKIWANDMSAYEGSVCSPCATFFTFRFPGSQWSTGEILVCAVYAILNLWCIYLSDWTLQWPESQHAVGRAFGSLSVANYMFTIIPATRNNILTWALGLPFDHVVLYHRAIGRWALFTATVHGALYLENRYPVYTYTSGYIALALAIVITVTSIDWFRRNHFNFFFVTHFAFVPFFYFVATHSPLCEPYVWTGLALYALDRILREVWSGFFHRSVEFYAKGDELAVVSCVKNPITEALNMHKVGQYYFINFPSISYSEWHPFSVSNGPREQTIEFHIRDLGDWTHDVCQKAIQASANPAIPRPYCRIDGPYGVHDFDCRRYPRMMLVGGGVGITPVIGILKDIYNVGKYSDSEKYRVLPHIVDTVYAVWVCRHVEDADWFLKDLELCAQNSLLPQFPKLQTWIYITRGKDLTPPLIPGRPEFPSIFEDLDSGVNQDEARKITRAATFVFACGPGAMVNELWDQSINRTLNGLRTDFHHETFDF